MYVVWNSKYIMYHQYYYHLLPFGGTRENGSHKGFGLGMMVEIMCGVYSGMNIGKKIPAMFTSPLNIRRKLSQSYIILRTDAVINQKDLVKLGI